MVTMYKLFFTDTARKQYEKLDRPLKGQVDKALERISIAPFSGKPLRGDLKGIFSERVSTFRVLYKVKKSEIEILVLTIEHRKSVYGGH